MTSRFRSFLPLFLLPALLVATPACAQVTPSTPAPMRTVQNGGVPQMPLTRETQAALTPLGVVQLLKDGNARFMADRPLERDYMQQMRLTSTGQYPMATILGCIDSRAPHEILFDKGIGDLFSARIAGNFINTDLLGSLEFATAAAGSKVIVVLGHTECGAIKGACDRVQLGNLTTTLANLYPAVYSVGSSVEGPRTSSNKAFVDAVSHANVDLTVQQIVDRSTIIRTLVAEGKLVVVGAMYDISTGRVTFEDDKMITAASLNRN